LKLITQKVRKEPGDVFARRDGDALSSFALRGRSKTQGYAIKSECGSELGNGLWHRGEKEAVIIDVEGQRRSRGTARK